MSSPATSPGAPPLPLGEAGRAGATGGNWLVRPGAEHAFEQFTEADHPSDTTTGNKISDDAPVVKFVNQVLRDAIDIRASDIHFEPFERDLRIRFRVDGVLTTALSAPIAIARRLAARLKVMAGLDIAERRLPQDGRIKHGAAGDDARACDLRVSTCPTLWGEKIVLRILDAASAGLNLDTLGMNAEQLEHYREAIARPYGMVLVTGPTGSGKTVTLYSALAALNDDRVNISTVEDPVEIVLKGINQVQHNPRQGLTFAHTLRAFLRQDPDVIMVGEIRDLETARIAVKAAQTGHLVLSTLHTNDAPQSVNRLINMGVPAHDIVSALHLVVAQRLVRTLHECKRPDRVAVLPDVSAYARTSAPTLYRPGGCDHCHQGYRGRTGVFQVMPVSPAIEKLILAGAPTPALAEQCRHEGIADLRASALEMAMAGRTSLAEVNRVTGACGHA